MAAETAAGPPVLSFPREIFATLQPRQFLLAHLSPPSESQPAIRPHGRRPSEWRKLTVNTNSLTHCHGSAVVRCGDTAVVCGVRGEILLASNVPNPPRVPAEKLHEADDDDDDDDGSEIAQLGLIVPNMELATGGAPAQLPGAAPSTLAQALTARLQALLHVTRLVRARGLRILHKAQSKLEEEEGQDGAVDEVKAYWTLYLDVLFISLDGSAFDAAWLAILAALRSAVLPKAWWDPDLEMILCSDDAAEARKLSLRGFPVPASFAVFTAADGNGQDGKRWILAEPDAFEEGLCRENVTLTVDRGHESKFAVKRLEKSGGGAVGKELMNEILAYAVQRWEICWDIIGRATG